MEMRAVQHHAWLHVSAQTWLITLMLLTLGLWYTAEAATSYTFTPVNLNVGEDPVHTFVTITGMKSSGMLIGEYFQDDGQAGELVGYRGLGKAFVMMPRLTPQAINDQNVLVGNFTDSNNLDAPEAGFVMGGTTFRAISLPGASVTRAYGINNAGTIVGGATLNSDSRGRAFRIDPGGTVTFINPPFGASSHYSARSINNHGDIVGQNSSLGWAWVGGVFSELRMPGNDANTLPLTINDKREIGGVFCRTDETCSGFILTNGVYQQIDVPGAVHTAVVGIDAKTGRLAVNATSPHGEHRGYLGTKAP
jgi:hypothetical protein